MPTADTKNAPVTQVAAQELSDLPPRLEESEAGKRSPVVISPEPEVAGAASRHLTASSRYAAGRSAKSKPIDESTFYKDVKAQINKERQGAEKIQQSINTFINELRQNHALHGGVPDDKFQELVGDIDSNLAVIFKSLRGSRTYQTNPTFRNEVETFSKLWGTFKNLPIERRTYDPAEEVDLGRSDSPSAGSPSAGSPSAGSPSAGSPSAGSPSARSPESRSFVELAKDVGKQCSHLLNSLEGVAASEGRESSAFQDDDAWSVFSDVEKSDGSDDVFEPFDWSGTGAIKARSIPEGESFVFPEVVDDWDGGSLHEDRSFIGSSSRMEGADLRSPGSGVDARLKYMTGFSIVPRSGSSLPIAQTSGASKEADWLRPWFNEAASADLFPYATGSGTTGADATGADATGADATGADATGADATGADAIGADATGAAFERAQAGWAALSPLVSALSQIGTTLQNDPTGATVDQILDDYRNFSEQNAGLLEALSNVYIVRNITENDQDDISAVDANCLVLTVDRSKELMEATKPLLMAGLNKIHEVQIAHELPQGHVSVPVNQNDFDKAQDLRTLMLGSPLFKNAAIATVSQFNQKNEQALAAMTFVRQGLEATNARLALHFLSEAKDLPDDQRRLSLPVHGDHLNLEPSTIGDAPNVGTNVVTGQMVAHLGSKFTQTFKYLTNSSKYDGTTAQTTFPTLSGFVNRVLSKWSQMGDWKSSLLPPAVRYLYSLSTNITSKLDSVKSREIRGSLKSRLSESDRADAVKTETVNTLMNVFSGRAPTVNTGVGDNAPIKLANAHEISLNLMSLNLFMDGYRAVDRSHLSPDQKNQDTPAGPVMRLIKQNMIGKMDSFAHRKLQPSYTGGASTKARRRSEALQLSGMIASRQFIEAWRPESVRSRFELAQSAVMMINGLSPEQRRIENKEVSRLLDALQKWDKDYTEQTRKGALSVTDPRHILTQPTSAEVEQVSHFKRLVFDQDAIAKVALADFRRTPNTADDRDRMIADRLRVKVQEQSSQIYADQRQSRGFLARFGSVSSRTVHGLAGAAKSAEQLSRLPEELSIPDGILQQFKARINEKTSYFTNQLTQILENNPDDPKSKSIIQDFRDGTAAKKNSSKQTYVQPISYLDMVPELNTVSELFEKAKINFSNEAFGTDVFDYSAYRLVQDALAYNKADFDNHSPSDKSAKGVLMGLDRGLLVGDSRYGAKGSDRPSGVLNVNVLDVLRPYSALEATDSGKVNEVIGFLETLAEESITSLNVDGSERIETVIQQRIAELTKAEDTLQELIEGSKNARHSRLLDLMAERRTEAERLGRTLSDSHWAVGEPGVGEFKEGVLHAREMGYLAEADSDISLSYLTQDRTINENELRAQMKALNTAVTREASFNLSLECIQHVKGMLELAQEAFVSSQAYVR